MSEVLYICGEESTVPKVWSWDGTSLTDLSAPTSTMSYYRCLYHDGKRLYAGTNNGRLYAMDRHGTWSLVFTSTDTTRDVCSVVRYDDGINGMLYYLLQGDIPNHAGGNLGVKLWYASDPTGSWTEVTSLPAGIEGGASLMVAERFLGILEHGTSANLWCNTDWTDPTSAIVGSNYVNVLAGTAANGHFSFFFFGDIGEGGGRFYAGRSVGAYPIKATTKMTGATWDDFAAGAWLTHPALGGHSVLLTTDNQLLALDYTQCEVGPIDETSAEDDLPGTGDGCPAAYAMFDGYPHLVYYNGGVASYIYKRESAASWSQELLDAGKVFYDAVPGPNLERSAFDNAGEITQCRLEPGEVSPLEGDVVFVLGSEVFAKHDIGLYDGVQVKTSWDFTATPLGYVGIFVRIRRHEDASVTNPGFVWNVSVGSKTYVSLQEVHYDKDYGWFPIVLPTGKASGTQDIIVSMARFT